MTFQIKKATQFQEVDQLDCDHVIRKRAHTASFNEIAYGPRRWRELNSAGALTRDNKMALTPKSSTKKFNNKSYNLIWLKLLFFLRSVIVSVIYFLSSGLSIESITLYLIRPAHWLKKVGGILRPNSPSQRTDHSKSTHHFLVVLVVTRQSLKCQRALFDDLMKVHEITQIKLKTECYNFR